MQADLQIWIPHNSNKMPKLPFRIARGRLHLVRNCRSISSVLDAICFSSFCEYWLKTVWFYPMYPIKQHLSFFFLIQSSRMLCTDPRQQNLSQWSTISVRITFIDFRAHAGTKHNIELGRCGGPFQEEIRHQNWMLHGQSGGTSALRPFCCLHESNCCCGQFLSQEPQRCFE